MTAPRAPLEGTRMRLKRSRDNPLLLASRPSLRPLHRADQLNPGRPGHNAIPGITPRTSRQHTPRKTAATGRLSGLQITIYANVASSFVLRLGVAPTALRPSPARRLPFLFSQLTPTPGPLQNERVEWTTCAFQLHQ